MVAFLGLLEQGEVLVEFLLFGEGDGVDTGELFAFLVATPVSTCQVYDFQSFDGAEIDQVRTAAQVGELARLVERNCAVLQLADKLQLVFVALFAEEVEGFGFGHLTAHHGDFCRHEFGYFLLYLGEIVGRDGLFAEVDVVVETRLDGRTDAEFGAGVEFFDGGSQKVCRGMPEHLFAFFVVPCKQLNGSILTNRAVQFHNFAVNLGGKHVAGQTLADAFCYVQRSNSLFVLTDRTVG